jgi:Mg-chelatase subunit ChlD
VRRPSYAFAALVLAGLAGSARADDPFGPSKKAGAPPPPAKPDAPPDPRAFRPWLEHEDWLCRALAARELRRREEPGVAALLASALEKETEPRAALCLLDALVGRTRDDLLAEGGAALVDALVTWLRHPHPLVSARAMAALEPLPPVRLPRERERYLAWWPKGREGLVAERLLAIERLGRARAAEAPSHETPYAQGETRTATPPPIPRYRDLDRIHREGLEIVVCLDSTGSMAEVIESAKANLRALVRRLRTLAPRVRIGLVTYDDGAIVRVPLTTDEDVLEKALGGVFASGGGDYEEGVDKAIRLAARQEKVAWSRKALRVVVVVGDAPPHEEDVGPLLRRLAAIRDDDLFESPLRVDTISTAQAEVDADGLVPHFAEIARAGHGTALRLKSTRDLVTELVTASFGPSWRDAIRALLGDLDAYDAAAPKTR